ncbi:hypothetical protein V8C42DRAFT_360542 [Trichoderma barbatum]
MFWQHHLSNSTAYRPLPEATSRERSIKFWILFIMGNIISSLTYLGVATFIGWKIYQDKFGGFIYSPARHVISYEKRVIDQSIRTPFHNGPSLATDAAWRDLLKYNNIALTAYDLERLNRSSVALLGREGFLGGLDVSHELHCLNFVRENIYSDYYAMPPKKFHDQHIFHCIDHLREIIMCHGNVAVHTFEWKDEYTFPSMKSQTQHVCRKWEPIVQWTKDKSPDRSDGGPILQHPILGIISPKPANVTQA